MASFPVDPPLAKALISSASLNCSEELATIVSMLSTNQENLFFKGRKVRALAEAKKKQFSDPNGDHLTLLNIYNSWKSTGYSEEWCNANYIQFPCILEAKKIREDLCRLMIK